MSKYTHSTLRYLILPVCVLALASCIKEPRSDYFAYSKWQPELDQPIEQLEDILAQLEQQQPMNYTISNIGFLYDVKLYIQFEPISKVLAFFC
jgi:hypothetical protein